VKEGSEECGVLRKLKIRDVFFGLGGSAIMYHEVVISSTAEPLLIFAAFFLLGLIPASRADDGGASPKEWLRSWLIGEIESEGKAKKDDK
jgi:hypothetical protein